MIEIATVLFPVTLCALLGAIWAHTRTGYDSDFVSRLVLNIGAPCLMLSVLGQVDIDPQVFGQTALACVLVMILMTLPGIPGATPVGGQCSYVFTVLSFS